MSPENADAKYELLYWPLPFRGCFVSYHVANAPGVHALCRELGSEPPLAGYVAAQETRYGRIYCGGQIEQSIRKMLSLDADS